MRTEAEVKAKLDQLRADRIHIINNRLVWSSIDRSKEIRALEWALAIRDEL